MRYITNKNGFTLIELMVVLAIIGIMVMIAVPSYIALLPSLRIREASGNLSSALTTARYRSISNGVEFRVLFDPSANTYQIDKGNAYTGSGVWATESAAQTLPPGITYLVSDLPTDGGGNYICVFGPDGRMKNFTSNTHNIDITNQKGKLYRIQITARTGYVQTIKT
ncbi:MAG: prepilin-type N-terminal cleavage/methylation domain-containing protein [Nitrospirae bacterium]|nr:prepilin-type N-terminal cleavage/methylation domain-containing protein [Nitrospirota bacterium]